MCPVPLRIFRTGAVEDGDDWRRRILQSHVSLDLGRRKLGQSLQIGLDVGSLLFAAQASGLDLIKAGFACMLEIQQNFFGACKVGADEIFVIFSIRQRVHDLFAELEVLRPHIEGAPALLCLGAHAPMGC